MLARGFVSVFIIVVPGLHHVPYWSFSLASLHECPFSCDTPFKSRLALPYIPHGIFIRHMSIGAHFPRSHVFCRKYIKANWGKTLSYNKHIDVSWGDSISVSDGEVAGMLKTVFQEKCISPLKRSSDSHNWRELMLTMLWICTISKVCWIKDV